MKSNHKNKTILQLHELSCNICKVLFFILLFLIEGCTDECNQQCLEKNLDCNCCPNIDTVNVTNDSISINSINVFIETSGSMKGYMPNNNEEQTNFQTLIPEILLRLRGEVKKTNLYSIFDSKSTFKKLDIDSARKNIITKGKFAWSGSTYIPIMLDSMNNYMDKESVNILISDCIYSPEKKDLGITAQTISEIREKFNKISKDYSTVIYSLHSEYFYSKTKSVSSPYYLILQGKSENIKIVDKMLKNSFKIFDQEYGEVHFGEKYSIPFYTILPYSENSGNNISVSCPSRENSILIMKEIEFSTKDTLNFVIGIDLKEFPVYSNSKDYLENNLVLSLNGQEFKKFKVLIKDEQISKIKSDDKILFEKCTHFIYVSISELKSNLSELNVSMKFSDPNWIKLLNNPEMDDNREKTYGLENMLKGIEEAYGISENSYFFKNLNLILIKK